MAMEQRRPKGPIAFGPAGRTAAENTRRLRNGRGLSIYQLSELLSRAGRPIAASQISKIERAERRVDVDDLMALAVALGVSPSALLLPADAQQGDVVEVAAGVKALASEAWDWADGREPLHLPGDDRERHAATLSFKLLGRPYWLAGGGR
jgi:transcriptional regulator with XRE-family HTH domain